MTSSHRSKNIYKLPSKTNTKKTTLRQIKIKGEVGGTERKRQKQPQTDLKSSQKN